MSDNTSYRPTRMWYLAASGVTIGGVLLLAISWLFQYDEMWLPNLLLNLGSTLVLAAFLFVFERVLARQLAMQQEQTDKAIRTVREGVDRRIQEIAAELDQRQSARDAELDSAIDTLRTGELADVRAMVRDAQDRRLLSLRGLRIALGEDLVVRVVAPSRDDRPAPVLFVAEHDDGRPLGSVSWTDSMSVTDALDALTVMIRKQIPSVGDAAAEVSSVLNRLAKSVERVHEIERRTGRPASVVQFFGDRWVLTEHGLTSDGNRIAWSARELHKGSWDGHRPELGDEVDSDHLAEALRVGSALAQASGLF